MSLINFSIRRERFLIPFEVLLKRVTSNEVTKNRVTGKKVERLKNFKIGLKCVKWFETVKIKSMRCMFAKARKVISLCFWFMWHPSISFHVHVIPRCRNDPDSIWFFFRSPKFSKLYSNRLKTILILKLISSSSGRGGKSITLQVPILLYAEARIFRHLANEHNFSESLRISKKTKKLQRTQKSLKESFSGNFVKI